LATGLIPVKSLLKWLEALQRKPRRAGNVELPVVGLEPTILSEQDFEACLHCWRVKACAVALAYFWPIIYRRASLNQGFERRSF
jgi:hypothetical protein